MVLSSGPFPKPRLVAWALALLVALWPLPGKACTLWAAAVDRVESGGVIIAKNRDWPPNHQQEPRFQEPPAGWRYLALYALRPGRLPSAKAGVNEKGLVIVSAAASCLPKADRDNAEGTPRLLERILEKCGSLDEARLQLTQFDHPAFYLMADKRHIALIEVGLAGERKLTTSANGVLGHTNHYLDPSLQAYNKKLADTSVRRLHRIRDLLRACPRPFTLTDFIAFSEDKHDGQDNSLWRDGRNPHCTRTLAAWIVALPRQGPPELYLKLANPHQPPRVNRLHLERKFWAGDHHFPRPDQDSPPIPRLARK